VRNSRFFLLDKSSLVASNAQKQFSAPMSRRLCFFVALLFGAANFASAQVTVATDPVGFTTTTLLGSPSGATDSFVSIPFTQPPEFIGGIASTTATTITVSGTPLTASQFKYVQGSQLKHYYALIGPGAGTKEGHTYAIADNTNNSLTVTPTALDDASGIAANAQVEVIPYWTPATIFPASDTGISFTTTTSPPSYQTLLRVPDYNAASYLAPPSAEYYFNGGHWQRINPAEVGDDDPLLPDGYFVVRNAAGVSTGSLTNIGTVLLKKLAVPLIAQVGQAQDNPASMVRPLNVALDATGLGPSDNSFGPNDQLLLFDNTAIGIDKAPSATYTYDTHWRRTGDATLSDRGADIITSGSGFVIRKVAGGTSAFWTNAFPVTAVSAVSRKVHGGVVGNLDIPLPLSGALGIECRSGGITQIIFTFPANVTLNTALGVQGGEVTSGTGSVTSVSGGGTNTVSVSLSGVTNAQWVTVTLHGINDGTYTNDVAVRAGVLFGDVNSSKRADSGDVTAVRSHTVSTPDQTTARFDVNLSGRIDSGDVTATRNSTVTALPPSP
jgi:uncharacterized protein (TIGR02597 family)